MFSYICWKRGVYFTKVDANGTSQICPQCGVNCGRKNLSQRVHQCSDFGFKADRDISAAMVVKKQRESSVGQTRKMLTLGQ
ncbi:MAG: zinc ribbon domain-containing protein [Halothece sp. Uz-M2-17]|nr:zinc ribbon domain-containing protein [Halothece sp. Uz-M2-17]